MDVITLNKQIINNLRNASPATWALVAIQAVIAMPFTLLLGITFTTAFVQHQHLPVKFCTSRHYKLIATASGIALWILLLWLLLS